MKKYLLISILLLNLLLRHRCRHHKSPKATINQVVGRQRGRFIQTTAKRKSRFYGWFLLLGEQVLMKRFFGDDVIIGGKTLKKGTCIIYDSNIQSWEDFFYNY
jgi:hypothetical protein